MKFIQSNTFFKTFEENYIKYFYSIKSHMDCIECINDLYLIAEFLIVGDHMKDLFNA